MFISIFFSASAFLPTSLSFQEKIKTLLSVDLSFATLFLYFSFSLSAKVSSSFSKKNI